MREHKKFLYDKLQNFFEDAEEEDVVDDVELDDDADTWEMPTTKIIDKGLIRALEGTSTDKSKAGSGLNVIEINSDNFDQDDDADDVALYNLLKKGKNDIVIVQRINIPKLSTQMQGKNSEEVIEELKNYLKDDNTLFHFNVNLKDNDTTSKGYYTLRDKNIQNIKEEGQDLVMELALDLKEYTGQQRGKITPRMQAQRKHGRFGAFAKSEKAADAAAEADASKENIGTETVDA